MSPLGMKQQLPLPRATGRVGRVDQQGRGMERRRCIKTRIKDGRPRATRSTCVDVCEHRCSRCSLPFAATPVVSSSTHPTNLHRGPRCTAVGCGSSLPVRARRPFGRRVRRFRRPESRLGGRIVTRHRAQRTQRTGRKRWSRGSQGWGGLGDQVRIAFKRFSRPVIPRSESPLAGRTPFCFAQARKKQSNLISCSPAGM